MPKFRVVLVPADSAELLAEWDVEYDEETKVSCLMDRLRKHYREEERRISRDLSPEQASARQSMTSMQVLQTAGQGGKVPETQMELMEKNFENFSSLVGQVALLEPDVPARQFESVHMYICDAGSVKRLPVNRRASEICALAGRSETIHGDAFVGRIYDDTADDFRRLDFTLADVHSDAPWLKEALRRTIAKPRRSMDELQALMRQQRSKEGEQHACVGCGKPASLRCSRCKIAWYCGQACQKADWPVHKTRCHKPSD